MNALDLAEMIELLENQGHIYAATMLRQQQAEIEVLKKQRNAMAKTLNAFGITELYYEAQEK